MTNTTFVKAIKKNHENKRLIKYLYAGLMRPHKGVHHLIKDFVKLINSVDTSEKIPVLFLCGEAKTKEEKEFKKNMRNNWERDMENHHACFYSCHSVIFFSLNQL